MFLSRRILVALLPGLLALVVAFHSFAQSANPIQIENASQGTTDWKLTNPAKNHEIEGYASLTSVNAGGQINFFVNTADATFTLTIYRLGWYQGLGGRQMTTPVDLPGTAQTVPAPDPTYGLVDCGWINPYVLNVPSNWVSGIYVAKLAGDQSGKQSYIIFLVRNDGRASDLLYQLSVNTSEAYNAYGGKSLYSYNSDSTIPQAQVGGARLNSAVKVSFNRPYDDGWGTGTFLSYEFDMVGFLEEEGYDVSYSTDVDTHAGPAQLTLHKGFLVVGHDEYWSWEMRQNVTAARDQSVSLGFFSADDCGWQIRFEPSLVTGDQNRTIVGYKEDASQDPDASDPSTYYLVTTQWRQPHVTLPAEPEDALIGVMYNGYEPVNGDILIGDTASWVFSNTGLKSGDKLAGLLGYEVDREFGDQPANTVLLTHSPYTVSGAGTQYGDMTVYQAPSGATVFAAGTIHWSWGLSNISPWGSSTLVNPAAQQITMNVLNGFINPQPSATPSATLSATPQATPTIGATAIPTATPTPSPAMTASPTPTATATPGAIGLRGTATRFSDGTTSVVVPVPSGVTTNDVMIAQVAAVNFNSIAINLAAPAGWTLIRADASPKSDQIQALYYRVAGASEPGSYTWTSSTTVASNSAVADYYNVSTSSPIDSSGGKFTASSSTITAPSITATAAGDRLLCFMSTFLGEGTADWTMPSGMTTRWLFVDGSNDVDAAMADQSVSAGPTGNRSATIAAAPNAGALVALIPASSGPTPSATATASPTPTPTASATATPSPTSSATPTPTAAVTVTPTPTASATATPSPTSSATPTPTAAVTVTPTPTASATTTPSPTSSATPTPTTAVTVTPSPAATATPTAILSPTPTAGPAPTPVATPTSSPTPSGPAGIKFTPASLTFAAQKVGTTSPPQTITVQSTGKAALTISAISVSGDFAETDNCAGATLTTNAQCTISVTFTPTSTGARNGVMSVTDNAPKSPQKVNLKGNGN